ncbi:hypothetical protein GS415_05460 [Rhodococcus hoagii]|nr:hypothetical protein [Prescottella equi]
MLTNAAGGGSREGMSVGQPVLISDHLNLTARSPLVGAQFVNPRRRLQPPVADPRPRDRPDPCRGRVRGTAGPHYETPAEIRMLRILGADMVGMSTVHETIAARLARGGPRHLPRDQPRRRHHRRTSRPRRGPRRWAGVRRAHGRTAARPAGAAVTLRFGTATRRPRDRSATDRTA